VKDYNGHDQFEFNEDLYVTASRCLQFVHLNHLDANVMRSRSARPHTHIVSEHANGSRQLCSGDICADVAGSIHACTHNDGADYTLANARTNNSGTLWHPNCISKRYANKLTDTNSNDCSAN
jgi:hypothetical protein